MRASDAAQRAARTSRPRRVLAVALCLAAAASAAALAASPVIPPWWPPPRVAAGPPVPPVAVTPPTALPNPIAGGGLSVRVLAADARRIDELTVQLHVDLQLTDTSDAPVLPSGADLKVWCTYPDSFAAGDGFDHPEAVAALGRKQGQWTWTPPLAPRRTVRDGPYVLELNVPLTDCAQPFAALDLGSDIPSSLQAPPVLHPAGGEYWLPLPVDVAGLVAGAAPLAPSVPALTTLCTTAAAAFPGITGLSQPARSHDDACTLTAGTTLAQIGVDAGYGVPAAFLRREGATVVKGLAYPALSGPDGLWIYAPGYQLQVYAETDPVAGGSPALERAFAVALLAP